MPKEGAEEKQPEIELDDVDEQLFAGLDSTQD